MKNPFKEYQEFVKKTPRNAFDKSFRNNLTLGFGYLYPDLVLDVTAGDSASIDAAFALNFDPMQFPIQTPVRISQYFFYDRYRNAWKNYKDYRYGNKPNLVHPYIKQPTSWWKTGSLCDYMGIPTTLPVGAKTYFSYPLDGSVARRNVRDIITGGINASTAFEDKITSISISQSFSNSGSLGARSESRANIYSFSPILLHDADVSWSRKTSNFFRADRPYGPFFTSPAWKMNGLSRHLVFSGDHFLFQFKVYLEFSSSPDDLALDLFFTTSGDIGSTEVLGNLGGGLFTCSYDSSTHVMTVNCSATPTAINNAIDQYGSVDLFFVFTSNKMTYSDNGTFALGSVSVYSQTNEPVDISQDNFINPFSEYSGHDAAQRINALPFRAYERIYNYFFRNDRVEPFMKNGQVEYNDFGTTDADGADTTNYQLKYRNWELDMFTSCLPTPQQGTAPIVGVDLRNISFEYDGNQYRFAYETGSDGVSLTGGKFDVEDVPGVVRSRAVDLVTGGFTINDLRNANAYQIWLEKNIRRGLRYRDQIKAHTGIDLDYNELDVPEFLGGFSHVMDVRSVTSSAQSDGVVLGDIAGQGSAFKKASHKINRFFQEDGVVIGIICITPVPIYSQALPKFYTRSSPLDYYNAEFSHLGMQPVPYAEVAPVQMYNEMISGSGTRNLQTVFGYNRPNYDMVSSFDEVHGYMRTTDRDFVMMRNFATPPELGAEFLHVKGEHLNDVFQVTDPNQHIAKGQVAFQIYMKRPIPAVGEPRLQ